MLSSASLIGSKGIASSHCGISGAFKKPKNAPKCQLRTDHPAVILEANPSRVFLNQLTIRRVYFQLIAKDLMTPRLQAGQSFGFQLAGYCIETRLRRTVCLITF